MEAVSNAWHSLAVKREKMRERTTGGGEEKKPRTGDEEKLKKNWEE
jgi:hypothetical protein